MAEDPAPQSRIGAEPARQLGAPPRLTTEIAADLARVALDNIRREYPNFPHYSLSSDADVAPPRAVHPAFFGCFDWHSAVHTHWLLVRLLSSQADLAVRSEVTTALSHSFAAQKIAIEAAHAEQRPSFERPYGLAWVMLLRAAVAECPCSEAGAWSRALDPLVLAARGNLLRWLERLRYPVRSGTHNQTAFAFTLLWDAGESLGDAELLRSVNATALKFYRDDVDAPLAYEPSGEDFLSPTLMEADLMRRLLPRDEFGPWLRRFLPALPAHDADWLDCGQVADERDGKLVHLHGLNLSRAWNLENIAAALASEDPRQALFCAAASRHARAAVAAALASCDYAATHWLPTFVVYLLTSAGAKRASLARTSDASAGSLGAPPAGQ